MRQKSINIIAQKRVAFNFFESKEVEEFFSEILGQFNESPETAKKILSSARTIKRHIKSNSEEIREIIQLHGGLLAKNGSLSLSIDHKCVTRKTGDHGIKDTLGVLLTLKRRNGKQFHYLIGFHAVSEKDDNTTLNLVNEILEVISEKI